MNLLNTRRLKAIGLAAQTFSGAYRLYEKRGLLQAMFLFASIVELVVTIMVLRYGEEESFELIKEWIPEDIAAFLAGGDWEADFEDEYVGEEE